MDFKAAVFNAAREGNLIKLRVYLHSWRSADELNMLVGAKVGGATPLVIACRNGHYDVAEYLIERCKADIEQPGSVTFDGETIEGAPPLWCAAAAGHLLLVRLLVRAGANVNSTTRTHSTPLRAACFDGHYDIVRFLLENGADLEIANRHGHTCLMIACYKGHIRIAKYLLSLNANVNRRSVKGNTALHDCAESGSLYILKMLLSHGAVMDVDSYGMTPLLAAAVAGHANIVEHLIGSERALVSRRQRIDALELLGATCVDKRRDMLAAIVLWKRAMEERFPADCSEPIPKPKDTPVIEAYEGVAEARSLRDLDDLMADPDAMRMQALAVRERILGPAHPDTAYYVRYRGAVYADAGRLGRCRALWHRALDMQQDALPPLSPLTHSSLHSFAELFHHVRDGANHRLGAGEPLALEHVQPVFRKALLELRRAPQSKEPGACAAAARVLYVALQLAALLADGLIVPEAVVEKELSRDIHAHLYELLKLDIKVGRGRSALHLACSAAGPRARGRRATSVGSGTAVPDAPSKALVALMLRLGADPLAQDALGDTPLHNLARLNPCPADVFRELLDHGAHIDTVNFDGETPEQILKTNDQNLASIVNPIRYTTLKCLAARTVKNYKLPYRHVLPQCLHSTVIMH